MMTGFPVYASHEDATCFKCGGRLSNVKPESSYYPPKHGQHMKRCECGWLTFYDVRPEAQQKVG